MLMLYAQKRPTVDPVSKAHGLEGKLDIALFYEQDCGKPAAIWPWFQSNCPRKGQKKVTLNCFRWNLVWV
jgi:hypothetical protein